MHPTKLGSLPQDQLNKSPDGHQHSIEIDTLAELNPKQLMAVEPSISGGAR
jgi:hypothetical protein